jgi:WhiB family redox-sensing transcriptional regulator
MSSGACRHADPELFFPAAHDIVGEMRAEKAKSLCAGCPVRGQCLAYALETRQKWGVWGGTTQEERQTMIRRTHHAVLPGRRRLGLRHPVGS